MVDIQKFMIKGMMKQANQYFKEKYGEDMPLDIDDLESLHNDIKRSIAEGELMYEMVRGLFIDRFGDEAFRKYEAVAQKKMHIRMTHIEELIEKLIYILVIAQGMKLGEDGITKKEPVKEPAKPEVMRVSIVGESLKGA